MSKDTHVPSAPIDFTNLIVNAYARIREETARHLEHDPRLPKGKQDDTLLTLPADVLHNMLCDCYLTGRQAGVEGARKRKRLDLLIAVLLACMVGVEIFTLMKR